MPVKSLIIFFGGLFVGMILGIKIFGPASTPGPVVVSPVTAPAAPGRTAGPDRIALQREIAQLEELLKDDRGNYRAWIQLGNNRFETEDFLKAVEAYQRALALDGSDPDVWTNLGVMYRRAGDYRQAIESFTKAAALDSGHVTSRLKLGEVYVNDLKDLEKGIRAWEEYLTLEPYGPRSDNILRQLEEIKKLVALPSGGGAPARGAFLPGTPGTPPSP